jgi:hypothetical protein
MKIKNWKFFNESSSDFEHMFILVSKDIDLSKIESLLNFLFDKKFDINKKKFNSIYRLSELQDVYLYIKYTGVVLYGDKNDFNMSSDKIYNLIDDEGDIYDILSNVDWLF